MSDKKRRDITLGEMQDECSFRGHNCETVGGEPCEYYGICNQIRTKSCTPPKDWDLSDPPRFTEAQMALLKGFYEIGIRTIERLGYAMWATQDASGNYVSIVNKLGLEENETLDLSELLGKEGENK
jgi:hypothetical protein